jgi:hypothetical protein
MTDNERGFFVVFGALALLSLAAAAGCVRSHLGAPFALMICFIFLVGECATLLLFDEYMRNEIGRTGSATFSRTERPLR